MCVRIFNYTVLEALSYLTGALGQLVGASKGNMVLKQDLLMLFLYS